MTTSTNKTHATALRPELKNAHLNPPMNGMHVQALTHGGKLVETVWNNNSILYFDAWCEFPTIPGDVKELQLSRFTKHMHH